MGFRGFTRQMQKNGAWFGRIALGTKDDPVFPPIHIRPSDEPSGDPEEGDIYFDSTAHALFFYDGTAWQEVSVEA